MTKDEYDADVIVVGGGIHGVGVAQTVAAAGYSVLLVEKSEIGLATSSKSSKLIHGGLRYLESFQFSLVKSCLKERALLLKNAPDLVEMVPFYIPVYEFTHRRPWKIALGLRLYHYLSGFKSPFKRLTRSEWSRLDNLSQDNLQAVFQYYDAQTDDLLLTKAVAKSAQAMGTKILTASEVTACKVTKNTCQVEVKKNDKSKTYRCRVMVNAAGAAVNEVLNLCEPEQSKLAVDLVQGTHILIDSPAKRGVFYMEAVSDKRAVFAIPWKGKTLVGTTETRIENSQDYPTPQEDEIDYLLKVYNAYFKAGKRSRTDVIESFAGLRVLPRGTESVFSRARDTVLHIDSENNPRLITLYGGKLTAYRATAEKVLQKISRSLPPAEGDKTLTENLRISS